VPRAIFEGKQRAAHPRTAAAIALSSQQLYTVRISGSISHADAFALAGTAAAPSITVPTKPAAPPGKFRILLCIGKRLEEAVAARLIERFAVAFVLGVHAGKQLIQLGRRLAVHHRARKLLHLRPPGKRAQSTFACAPLMKRGSWVRMTSISFVMELRGFSGGIHEIRCEVQEREVSMGVRLPSKEYGGYLWNCIVAA
jgi:hypothetical protein